MARRFELIVFDWDGTLMDSAAAIVRAIQAASRDMGVPEPDEATARHVIGLGLVDALRHAVPTLAPEDYPKLADRYRYHYLARDHELTLFEGAAELVEELNAAGYLLAVATGKSRAGLDRAMAQTGIGRWFHTTRCADECHSKPHPQMLLEIMDFLDAAPERTLMVGDTVHDLQLARNAEASALAVSFGAHPEEHLLAESPLACVDTPAALADWLRRHG